jgi:hypothetical protein
MGGPNPYTIPTDASAATGGYIGQTDPLGCGPAAAMNALISLEGVLLALTPKNQALYNQFEAVAAAGNGEDMFAIRDQFNAFAAGTQYVATVTRGPDPFELAETATANDMPFIGSVGTFPLTHAQVYIPQGTDQDQVISSTTQGAYTWTMSTGSVGSGLNKSSPNNSNYYYIVQTGFK